MSKKIFYSWYSLIFNQIKKEFHTDRLAHALLFYVPTECSIKFLLEDICSLLLNTKLQLSQYHPDLYILNNTQDQIRLDEIKKVLNDIYLMSAAAKAKILLL